MTSFSSYLILAVLAAGTSDGRHPDSAEIYACDFGQQSDVNYDGWPDRWQRRYSTAFPHYVSVKIQPDKQAVAGHCLTAHLDGGGALLESPAIAVSSKFNYVLEARLRTAHLHNSRAQLRLDICDQHRNVLQSHVSQWFSGTRDWTKIKIKIDPAHTPNQKARLAIITLHIDRGDQADLQGEVSLDDVWLGRLPRMTVSTDSPFNVYTDPKDIVVTCELSGILERNPNIRFELLDASSSSLGSSTVQLDGWLIDETLSKASDIVSPPKKHRAGEAYAGHKTWQPPIRDFGFYKVRVTMENSSVAWDQRLITIAVVPPKVQQSHGVQGAFGWSLTGGNIPLSLEELEKLLPHVAINWVKYPVWYGQTESQRGDELVRFTERLAAKDIEIVGVLDRPPADVDMGQGIGPDATIAELLSVDSSAWLPSLDAVITRLSLRVRWWQLGVDRDTSYADFHSLEKELFSLREKLFRFGQDVNLGIGWPWNHSTDSRRSATWDFQQYSSTPTLTGAELASYLQLPARSGVGKWVLIDPLPRDDYSLETRSRDLVQQMLAAKIHGAQGIFAAHPFDAQRGLMTPAGSPGEMLLPWRTTASLLSGTRFIGSIRMPHGSENRLFETPEGEVLMVVWNPNPTKEVLYLGNDVRVLDVWGRTTLPEKHAHRQVIPVKPMPVFVLGINPHVAKWRMSIRFDRPGIPSVIGRSHPNAIEVKNHFPQGTGGWVHLVPPEGWKMLPEKIEFKLGAGERSHRPFEVNLPLDADSGKALVRADFDFEADQHYRFSVYRDLLVGDSDIELELQTRLESDGSLIVQQRLVNHGNDLVDFKCVLFAPGRKLHHMKVFRLGSNPDVKIYQFPRGQNLIGQELSLRAEELGGSRVLNHRFFAEQ